MGKRLKKDSIHYVNNKEFTEAVSVYAKETRETLEENEKLEKAGEQPKELPKMSNYIGSCVLKIAQRLATRPNFVNYSFKDEMISDGVENVFLYLKNFDAEAAIAKGNKPNAFAYVTQIIYFAFLRRIDKEKKQQHIKEKSIETAGIYQAYATTQDHDDTVYTNEYMNTILNNQDMRNAPKKKGKKKTTKKTTTTKSKKKTKKTKAKKTNSLEKYL
jgi:hypothetical protein